MHALKIFGGIVGGIIALALVVAFICAVLEWGCETSYEACLGLGFVTSCYLFAYGAWLLGVN